MRIAGAAAAPIYTSNQNPCHLASPADNDGALPAWADRRNHDAAAGDRVSAGADAKVPAGTGHVATATIEIHPGQPHPSFPA